MAWRFPKWRELDGYPVDVDTLNESVEAFLEEMDGLLNEHNWANEAVTRLSDVAPDATVQMRSRSVEVSPSIGQGNPPWYTIPLPIGVTVVSSNLDWFVLDQMTTTVNTDNVNLWIMASFQQRGGIPLTTDSVRFGSQYGIRVDGYVIWETVIGGADRSNDLRGEGFGGNNSCFPVVIDAVLPVTSGTHLIEIVQRTIRNENFDTPSTDDFWMVFNRELIIVELY